jgi:putative nucleotidyltransferase with HDIG domain
MNVAFPRSLAALIDRVRTIAAGDGIALYVVGGTVRDALLGRESHDLDVAADRDAISLARHLAAALGGHFVELDDVNAIARVVLDAGAVRYIDVAQVQGALEDDMRRRDFTVDALAVAAGTTGVIDVTGGVADIGARSLRMTSPAVFDADPLRLLRGARIAAELHLSIDPATEREIAARAATVTSAAGERIRDELARIFALDDAYSALRLLDRLGLLDAILPELVAGRGVTQPGPFHAYDVLEHNLHAVDALDVMLAPSRPDRPDCGLWSTLWETFAWREESLRAYLAAEMSEGRTRASVLKFAALLHDIAKPQTRTLTDDGNAHFYGHAELGAEIAGRIMRRLRFSAAEVRFVATLVEQHLRPVQLAPVGVAPTRRALYRFHRDLGDAAEAALLLSLADAASVRGLTGAAAGEASEPWLHHVRYMNSLLVRSIEEEGILHPPRLITGRDIMARLALPEGPLIGRILEAIREAQATGEVRDAGDALALARRLAAGQLPGDVVSDA